ncbi:UNVERIFIED_CONTAM: hypothetical protein GTU68_031530 [Idotea baltica]|nr:hypothetical protein [Idotea baltica]
MMPPAPHSRRSLVYPRKPMWERRPSPRRECSSSESPHLSTLACSPRPLGTPRPPGWSWMPEMVSPTPSPSMRVTLWPTPSSATILPAVT